jgi:butyryl-CoA dehydrogenase
MDFSLSKQHEMLKNMVSEFAKTELSPKAMELDEKGEFPFEEVKRAAALGLVGIVISKRYGGAEMGHLARVIAIEEMSKAYPPLGFFIQVGSIGMYMLETDGTEDQKKKYLPSLCKGEKIMSTALTEASGGSDPAAMQTTAKADGDVYVLNGRKQFISFVEAADLVCVTAKTDDKFNVFIVEKGTSGFEIVRRDKHEGLRSIPVNEFALTNCHVSKANMVGQEGKGLGVTMGGIAVMGRMGAASVGLGIAQGCYEIALKFAKERKLYGKRVADLQAILFMLVDISSGIEAARLLTYKAACLLDQGKNAREAGTEIARAKLYACDLANDVAFKTVRILGGAGTTPEYQVTRRMRDALELLPAAGTQEIMKVVIGGGITR